MSSSLPLVVDEALLKCPLCCRAPDDPRLLPCLHFFCRLCLVNYVDKCKAKRLEANRDSEEQTKAPLNDNARTATRASLLLFAPRQKKTGSLSRRTSTGYTLPPAPPVPAQAQSTTSRNTGRNGLDGEYEEGDGYEVPNDHHCIDRDTYEDVEQEPEELMYVNCSLASSPPSWNSRQIERGNMGYVSMGKALPQQHNVRRRCRSAPRTHSNNVTVSGSPATTSSPSFRRSSSPINRGQHAQRRVLDKSISVNDDGLYENSEEDVADNDVIQENRKSRITSSSREVRRWKVAGDLSGVPPRMKRRIRRDSPAASPSTSALSSQKSTAVTPNAAVRLTKDGKLNNVMTPLTGNSTALPNRSGPEISSFEYIYGDRQRKSADELLVVNKADTLDKQIPVYEVFKSSKSSEKLSLDISLTGSVLQNVFRSCTTDGYVELEQRRVPTSDRLYDIELTLDDPSHPKKVNNHDNALVDVICPVCNALVNVPTTPYQGPEVETCNEDVRSYGVSVDFVSAMTELVRLQTVDWRQCGECNNESRAESRCLQCRRDLCSTCRNSHSRSKQLESEHCVVDLQDVQSGRHQKELILTGLPVTPCRSHPSRHSVGFCTACDATVCDLCRSSGLVDGATRRRGGHRDAEHNVIEMKSDKLAEAASRERDLISTTLLSEVERRLSQLKTDGDQIAIYQRDLETERQKVLNTIAEKKVRLLSAVQECYDELVQSINDEYTYEKDNVRVLTAAFDKNSARVEHALRFVRHLFELGRPVDVTSLAAMVRSGLRAACRVPEVTIDARLTVGFLSTDDVKKDRIRRLFGPMTIDRVPCVAVHPDGVERTSGSIDRRKRRKSSTSDVENTRRVRRKPSLREPVAVTSFSAKTALDEKGCKPTGLAVVDDPDAVGQCLIVIVDDINKKLKVFDAADGTLRLEIKPEGCQRLVDPWDVAVLKRLALPANGLPAKPEALSEPRFVVSDRGAHDVKTFTESGKFVTSFGSHLSSPWGVATSTNVRQILVTDAAHKTVFIHDVDGNLLFCVQSKVESQFLLQCPEYVAVSPVNGDIVVTDFERHTVVFFDKFGRFLTQYNGDNNETTDVSSNVQRRLKVPCGVAVSCAEDGGRVYVADYNNRRIIRLTCNGRYDACFAANISVGLVSPQAIDFTIDGRLVVADRTNLKIFDVGVRRRNKSFRGDVEGSSTSSFVVQPETRKGNNVSSDQVSVTSPEGAVVITKTTITMKPRPIGPKPIITSRPRPPISRVGTVATAETGESHLALGTSTLTKTSDKTEVVSASSKKTRRSSVTSAVPGTSSSLKIPKNDSNGNATTSIRSYLETEVW